MTKSEKSKKIMKIVNIFKKFCYGIISSHPHPMLNYDYEES